MQPNTKKTKDEKKLNQIVFSKNTENRAVTPQ